MIDANVLSQLVENEIKKNVEQQVQQIIKNKTWLEELEKQIIDYAQNRILGKFKNISTIPDLVQTVETSVTKLFEQGAIPGIENYISQKREMYDFETSLKNWEKKVEIMEMAAKRSKVLVSKAKTYV
jgi:xylose isomerase